MWKTCEQNLKLFIKGLKRSIIIKKNHDFFEICLNEIIPKTLPARGIAPHEQGSTFWWFGKVTTIDVNGVTNWYCKENHQLMEISVPKEINNNKINNNNNKTNKHEALELERLPKCNTSLLITSICSEAAWTIEESRNSPFCC